MAGPKERTFGQVIHERRRQLHLTQQEVARRIRTSTPYISHLESGKRHPSDKVLGQLAEVLALEPGELFFLGNPMALIAATADACLRAHTKIRYNAVYKPARPFPAGLIAILTTIAV